METLVKRKVTIIDKVIRVNNICPEIGELGFLLESERNILREVYGHLWEKKKELLGIDSYGALLNKDV
jgi:hypothetical protein